MPLAREPSLGAALMGRYSRPQAQEARPDSGDSGRHLGEISAVHGRQAAVPRAGDAPLPRLGDGLSQWRC
jgi:hypothetical protein